MKKFNLCMLHVLCSVIVLLGVTGAKVFAEDNQPSMMDLINEAKYQAVESDKPKSAILIDGNTGKFLWGENEETPHNPASIMKLMTIYLTYEAMEKGKFTMDTMVEATQRHQQIANIYEISNNKIVAGISYPVKELLPMALVPSSNVATMMLAELVEPDAVKFLGLMNDKAKELGMNNTKIVNATGAEISAFQGLYANEGVDTSSLDTTGSNETTAKDFSIFTYNLLKNFPQILEYTSKPTVTVMKDTPNEETFETYNYSIPSAGKTYEDVDKDYSFEGVDGLKTGSSPSGAFNIDITAKRGDLRLIAIVFGVGDWSDQTGEYKRHPFANAILNYGFNHFEYKELVKKGEQTIDEKDINVLGPLLDVVKKDSTSKILLNDNKTLMVENSLKPVSEKIQPISVKYEEEEKDIVTTTKKHTNKLKDKSVGFISSLTKSIDLSNPFIKGAVILFGSIFLLLILLIGLLIRSNRKRKKARLNRRKRFEEKNDQIGGN